MKRHCYFILLIAALFLLLFTLKNVSANAIGLKGSENQGLYNASDHVVILNVSNINLLIYNSSSSWIVEFYSNWCGHCKRYASIWKTFAHNINSWRNVVQVGVLDCANDYNNPTCRDFEIMSYPSVRFFSVNSKNGSLGLDIHKGNDAVSMQNALIKQLEIEQQDGRGSTWPNIIPYRKNELESIWKAVTDKVKYSFLIFEEPDSYLGTSVILDIQNVSEIHIRRVTSENELLCVTAKVTKFPSLILLHRNGSQQSISLNDTTRVGIRQSIQGSMALVGIHIKMSEEYVKQNIVPNISPESTPETSKFENSENSIQQFGDVIFQIDLESTLHYSINKEIPLSKIIVGEKLSALKAYLNILSSYFRLRDKGATYLPTLYNVIRNQKNITGKSFRNLVSEIEYEITSIYSGNREWIGCKGSTRVYRGYTCGLWTMFHTLTVNFANQNFEQEEYDPAKVLRAMYGYVKHFFGCAECKEHFVEMANRDQIFEVKNEDESILWLWKAHNKVNKRLAGDLTEDPQHKKIQYPAKNDCPSCRDENDNWIESEVLKYLKKKYRYDGINFYKSSLRSNSAKENNSQFKQKLIMTNSAASIRKLGWDFNIFDISICVVLYVMSASILILVCIKFASKRNYKKKTYIYSLFDKV